MPIEHDGRLWLFFGDVLNRNNADPMASTSALVRDAVNMFLEPVLQAGSQNFEALRIDAGAGPRDLGTNETPTGGFSYDGAVWLFVVIGDQNPVSFLVRSADVADPFAILMQVSSRTGPARLLLPAGRIVRSGDWTGLTDAVGGAEQALLIWGWGLGQGSGINLAVAPMCPGSIPATWELRYWNGRCFTAGEANARPLFGTETTTLVSVGWLEGPRVFVMLYTKASPVTDRGPGNTTGPIVCRFGWSPWLWSDELVLFDPNIERAYGRFMHWPGSDNLDNPYLGGTGGSGWAYAPGVIDRFTDWNATEQSAAIYYTMSTNTPYQVQLMRSSIRFARAVSGAKAVGARPFQRGRAFPSERGMPEEHSDP